MPSTSKSSKMEYGVVTQVFLCLTPDQCNVRSVSELMAEQVGFAVILLDSKCYALSSNSGTSGTDFWKSTRRILAASKSLYEQLSGHDSGVEHAEVELTQPSSKKPRKDTCTLVEILDKVSAIEQKVSVPRELTRALQCSICQRIASPPVVLSCCQRVVACAGCNHTWRRGCERCPLCNTSSQGSVQSFELPGFDDVVHYLDGSLPRKEPREPAPVTEGAPGHLDTDSEEDFEELPNYRVTSQ